MIEVKGTIVSNDDKWIYDYFGVQSVCPADVIEQMEKETDDIIKIEVNSGGGSVFSGNEIYYLINQSKKKTQCDIVGFAGSAATIICCAADIVRAVPGAQYMIHNVSAYQEGDCNDMDHMSDILKTANKSIATVYMQKTRLSEKELLSLMNKETWMSATDAKEKGFIDEIINENPRDFINASGAIVIPKETIEKVRNQVKNPGSQESDPDFLIQKTKTQLSILRMRGDLS